MKRITLRVGACFFFGLSMLCAFQFRAQSPIPMDLVITPIVHDFGDVGQKSRLVTDFVLSNRQDRPIKIVDVFKDCDCNEVALDKFGLAPGESTKLKVTWDTRQRVGAAAAKVYLYYDNGSGIGPLSTILTVKANVIPDIDWKPTELTFPSNTASENRVAFTSNGAKELRIGQAYCSHAAFCARVISPTEIAVTFDPKLWRRNGEETAEFLTVMTSSPRESVNLIRLNVIQSGGESDRRPVAAK